MCWVECGQGSASSQRCLSLGESLLTPYIEPPYTDPPQSVPDAADEDPAEQGVQEVAPNAHFRKHTIIPNN